MAVSSVNGGAIPLSPNAIINGAFDIWQRGTSITQTANEYTADRWRISAATFPTLRTASRQTFTPNELKADGFGDARFYFRSTITTLGSSTAAILGHRVEDVRTLAGQTATLSFWAKSDSTRTQSLKMLQVFGSGGSANVEFGNTTYQTTTAWQRFTFSFTVPSVSGKTIAEGSWMGPDLSQALADGSVFDIWGVQLEAGTVATPFRRNANSLQGELAACQRYFYNPFFQAVNANLAIAPATAITSSFARAFIPFPVTMRVPPAPHAITPGEYFLGYSSQANSNAATTIDFSTSSTQGVLLGIGITGITANQHYYLYKPSPAGVLGFSAEL